MLQSVPIGSGNPIKKWNLEMSRFIRAGDLMGLLFKIYLSKMTIDNKALPALSGCS